MRHGSNKPEETIGTILGVIVWLMLVRLIAHLLGLVR